ncbi:MAG TPA: adenylosuccinate synthetase [Nitrososphaerales archaeon]|nr:adenylosuccinate synthetase [Nitrososphaerales archaeon]
MTNLSVVGLQWGDEGKGKVVDYLAGGFDAVARYSGGSNAGHTVVIGTSKHTFHLLPSGALKGKELLIGAGVVVDPVTLKEELALLPDDARGHLTVDARCSLVSPQDKELDGVLEEMRGATPIGTTKRGIGPSYALRALRLSPRVSDLVGEFNFASLSGFYQRLSIDPAGLVAWADESRKLLVEIMGDVGKRVVEIDEKGGSVLFEGSQGTLLDLLHGSYPYVTSTHTTASYIPVGLGIPPSLAGKSLGVAKAYTTRVGSGPFPTEIKGDLAERIRSVGNEYGATTGRPRRVGWLDLVALKYAVKLNGASELAVSKVDVLSRVGEFRVCVAYRRDGSDVSDFQRAQNHLGQVEPVYESPFPLHDLSFTHGFPRDGKKLVDYLEDQLKTRVRLVSYGEERSMTVEL